MKQKFNLKHLTVLLIISFISNNPSFAQLNANFTSSPASGCAPLLVSFTDQSTGNPVAWSWDLGNGAMSNQRNPSTTYLNGGVYTVKLTVTNSAGQTHSVTKPNFIIVNKLPEVNFTATNTSGCFPLPVSFTDQSLAGSGVNTGWFWDFGDGTTSTQQNPTHFYQFSGTFSVTLKVTNSGGCVKTFTRQGIVQVSQGVNAGFTNSVPVACNPPETISFTNTTTGPGTITYQWNFGDGGTSTQASPTHTYNSTGPFTVTLIAQSSFGCIDTIIKPNVITIMDKQSDFSGPLSVCQGMPATFSNISVPSPVSYSWDLGDGTTAPQGNVSKTWTQAGVYNLKLINQYPTCSDTVIKQVTVLAPPLTGFTLSDSISCKAPFVVNFTGPSSGVAQWAWEFGDGTVSTLQNPAQTYLQTGSYSVKLKVTGTNGCTDSISMINLIRIEPPVVSITGLPAEGCIPYTLNVAPVVTAIDGVSGYSWLFGDGGSSAAMSPSHVYTSQGTYTVQLIVTTNDGCKDTTIIPDAVRVGTKPIANFIASPLQICAGQPISFTNQSLPSDRWLWDFGDGNTSTAENPQYAYADTGSFDIMLIASNSGCKDTLIRAAYVNILAPVARFIPEFNCVDKKRVVFNNESLSGANYQWDFGDGNTSTLENPVHTFAAFGTYLVKLTISNNGCTNSLTIPVTLINELPLIDALTDTICRNQSAVLLAYNINPANISLYTWDFGDGIVQAGQAAEAHQYAAAGIYTVKLTTTDIRGCETSVTRTNLVRVFGPSAGIGFTPQGGCLPQNVTLLDETVTDGVNNIVSWVWSFGDGQSQSYNAPPFQHVYDNIGYFYPALTVTDSYGCTSSFSSAVPVYITDPIAAFSTPDTLSCSGGFVQFNSNSLGHNLSWSWNFGDGTTSADANPLKTYTADGDYSVILVVTDINGCTDSVQKNNLINVVSPQASFSIGDSISSCAPFKVEFTNNSNNGLEYRWEFNDGNESGIENPTHYYTVPGVYNAKLTTISQGGCTAVASRTVTLHSPDATLSYIPLEGCSPLSVTLNISTAGPVTYLWDLDDGNTIATNDSSINYTYMLPGDFIPKVIMEDQTGCRIPVAGVQSINVTKSYADFAADDSTLCDQGTVQFISTTNSNGVITSYSWMFGDGGVSGNAQPSHNYQTTGNYNVTLIVTTQNGCIDSVTKPNFIKVVSTPDIEIGGANDVCLKKSLSLTGILVQPDTSVLTWNWDLGNGNRSNRQNPLPQSYTTLGDVPIQLITTNSSGCSDTASAIVTVNPLPTVDAGPDITIAAGNTVTLSATGESVNMYAWTPAANVECFNCQETLARPTVSDSYIVTCTDANGCVASDNLFITVTCSEKNVFIPNTFSPNNDGMNDVFYPRGKGVFTVKSMRIYNRWGELIFSRKDFNSNEAGAGWDGTYRGMKAGVDVYTYIMEVVCANNEIFNYKGNVTLIK